MQLVVIGMADDCLEVRRANDPGHALSIGQKFREHGFERVSFTDGVRFFSRENLQDLFVRREDA